MATKLNTNTSVVDYLKSQDKDSSFAARKKLAEQQGIPNYTGTAAQNTKLLGELKTDDKKSSTTSTKKTTTTSSTKTSSSDSTKKTTTTTKPKETTTKTKGDDFSNENVYDIINNLSAQGVGNPYVRPDYTNVTTPELRSAQTLADLYGIDYNKDSIYGQFNNAVDTAYAQRKAEQNLSDNKYYDNVAALNDTAQANARSLNGAAIATGASKGMQAANQLAALLGISQQTAQGATDLANARYKMAGEQATAKAQANVDALKYYDTLGTTLGGMSRQLYSDDIQQMTSQLGYNQAINTDYAGNASQVVAANAGVQQAQANALSSMANADTSRRASNYAADRNVDAYATYGSQAAITNAQASKDVANINAGATKYAADRAGSYSNYNGGTGSTGGTGTTKTVQSTDKTGDYLNKIGTAAANGASPAIINDMITSGMQNGTLTAPELQKRGASSWNEVLVNGVTGGAKTPTFGNVPVQSSGVNGKTTTKNTTTKSTTDYLNEYNAGAKTGTSRKY